MTADKKDLAGERIMSAALGLLLFAVSVFLIGNAYEYFTRLHAKPVAPVRNTHAPTSTAPNTPLTNTVGVLLYTPPTQNPLSIDQKIALTKELGVRDTRVLMSSLYINDKAIIPDFQKAGFTILLNINNNVTPPTTGVDNIDIYKKNVATIIDTYHPDLVVIENEETNPQFNLETPQDYLTELQAAIDVAHSKGIKVANGGLTTIPISYLTWKQLWDSGDHAKADAFAQTAFSHERLAGQILLKTLPNEANPDRPINMAKTTQKTIAKTVALIAAYKTMDLDYVNIHWYENDGSTTAALPDVVAYLREATGKPVMSNEFGQLDTSPATVMSLLQEMINLQLPYEVWFSGDDKNGQTPGGGNGAYALQDAQGNLRPNGEAFIKVMQKNFGTAQIK